MGFFDFFRKKRPNQVSEPPTTAMEPRLIAKKAELVEHDKQEFTVKLVTLDDMKQYSALPFEWNSDIVKVTGPSTQPYAYMDLIGPNVDIAADEIDTINMDLLSVHHLSPLIDCVLQIPIWELILHPREHGSYSKIICTPHTFTGRPSKYPASLLFMTELAVTDADTTHGELFYDRSGKVAKARVCFWRGENQNRKGYFVYFKTLNGELTVVKIESTVIRDSRGLPGVIYKAP